MKLTFCHDAGHGWLQVPIAMYELSGFKASRFSYIDNEHVYLEEDCDAEGFERKIKAMNPDFVYTMATRDDGNRSLIRNLDRVTS